MLVILYPCEIPVIYLDLPHPNYRGQVIVTRDFRRAIEALEGVPDAKLIDLLHTASSRELSERYRNRLIDLSISHQHQLREILRFEQSSYGRTEFKTGGEPIEMLIFCAGPFMEKFDRYENLQIRDKLGKIFSGIPPEYLIMPRQKRNLIAILEQLGEERSPQITVVDEAYPISYGQMISTNIGTKRFDRFVRENLGRFDYIIGDGCPFAMRSSIGFREEGLLQIADLLKDGGIFLTSASGKITTDRIYLGDEKLVDLLKRGVYSDLFSYRDGLLIRKPRLSDPVH